MPPKKKEPRLRTADKVPPPYPLQRFPKHFAFEIGKQVIYIVATKQIPTIEGSEWEQIFAKAINAEWKPSNVGLDDIVLGNCAWGAKTVKAKDPWNSQKVRLISGRNSPVFSYGDTIDTRTPPDLVGEKILEIWNARVDFVRSRHKHVRTVVLVKSADLLKLTVFETETLIYNPAQYKWFWNKRGNLEGYYEKNHKFTWQPHGSQFTIIENIPKEKLCVRLRAPSKIDQNGLLKSIGFDNSWVEIIDLEKW